MKSSVAKALSDVNDTRFGPYQKYRDSGIDWLGSVPVHWTVNRVKTVLVRNDGGVWGDDFDADGTIILRSTEQTVDGGWRIDDPARRTLTAKERASARLLAGDLVITKSSGSELHIGKTSLVTPEIEALDCCYSNFMQRLRVHSVASARFVWYILNGPIGRAQFVYWSNTTTGLANLNGSIIGNVRVALPPLVEQEVIADVLDRETARIDALVAKKRRLIELLEEKRTALISHAVTKGLDPNVPFKESGDQWIGAIPRHWDYKSLGCAVRYISYGFTNPMPVSDEGPFMLTANDIADGHVDWDNARRTTEQAYRDELTDKSRPRREDVLITKDGTLGRVAVSDGTTACINQSVALMRVNEDVAWVNFVHNALRAAPYQEKMSFDAGGTTIKHIYITRLVKMRLAFPPRAEQEIISQFADEQNVKYKALIERTKDGIDRLTEYRTALISAAVTGKIDVRGEVVTW